MLFVVFLKKVFSLLVRKSKDSRKTVVEHEIWYQVT